ncbi:putative bifunctional diguanylate cyclase/phosphodiesterase [Roseovarius sp. D22-M7]|uniref:putative bifunctional diguanylate cyclase/phosphodiesterase n=1 Tax=Roseovarius sp. D22-M7 TaxID=3127116 RepID=UPI0030106051
MNVEAAKESKDRINGRLKTLQEQVSLIASDYHNWTDIFIDAHNLDYESLASNYGITAERGDIFQYAELFDGPFPKPISWRKERGLIPQEGFLDDFTRATLRDQVRRLDARERETFDYFSMREGRLVIFSSSKLLPESSELLTDLDLAEQPVAVIGKSFPAERLTSISAEFAIRNLMVVDDPQNAQAVSVPITGVVGQPVAWLEWLPPKPGTVLFQKMAPIMTLVSLVFAVLFWGGAKLLRDRATKLVAKEAVSSEQARTDTLTALPNRFALFEHFKAISADGTLDCGVIIMDLDAFKNVNDTIGHIGGDVYLTTLASRLASLSDDNTFVGRLGGDEFVIVIRSANDIRTIINQKCIDLEKISSEQITCKDMHFDVLSSKGMAVMDSREFCKDDLLRRADFALYVAKKHGTQKVVSYDASMEREDQENQIIENRLRLALVENSEFSIAYQPIVTLNDVCEIKRCEALARWYCKDLGQVPPDKFIYVAETSGLIIQLGWLLLDIICRDLKGVENCRCGVNISPVQLMMPGFADLFAERVERNGVRPEQIEVEVTEQIVIRDEIKILHELTSLRNRGFTLALDDFGTGYASVSYLTRMPFDVLKIDRSFAKLQADNRQLQRMVRSMMGLAHSMDLHIVIEGIETPEEAVWFRALGADFLQGYFFGRPVPFTDYLQLSGSPPEKRIPEAQNHVPATVEA